MSLQDDIFAADAAFAFFADGETGTTVVYVGSDDAADRVEDVPANLSAQRQEMVDTTDGRMLRREITVMIPTTGDNAVASPKPRARLEIDGEAWDIEVVKEKDGPIATLIAVRLEHLEKTHRGYRIPRR